MTTQVKATTGTSKTVGIAQGLSDLGQQLQVNIDDLQKIETEFEFDLAAPRGGDETHSDISSKTQQALQTAGGFVPGEVPETLTLWNEPNATPDADYYTF